MRRNWHLLPYEQLLELLDMSADEFAFRLREDDFLYAELGSLKPHCERVSYRKPDAKSQQRAAEIRTLVHEQFGDQFGRPAEPRFGFIDAFNRGQPRRQPD